MPRIMKTDTHSEFNALFQIGREKGEKNDCSVKAVALITGKTYDEAHIELQRRGRINRQGVQNNIILDAAAALGEPTKRLLLKDVYHIIQSYPKPHYGLKNITSHHPRRFPQIWSKAPDCLLFSNAHVAAFINGAVIDWSVNNVLRIVQINYRERDEQKMMEFIEWVKSQRSADALRYWNVRD